MRTLEAKLTPSWLAGMLDQKEHVIADERARRAALERRVRELRDQITSEESARTQLQDKIERLGADLDIARTDTADNAKLRAENDELEILSRPNRRHRWRRSNRSWRASGGANRRSKFASTWAPRDPHRDDVRVRGRPGSALRECAGGAR